MEDKFFGRALTILLIETVLPSLPTRFSILTLTDTTEGLSERKLTEIDRLNLRKRLRENMNHFVTTGVVLRQVELTESNQPITIYTKADVSKS
jgi:hypothetical protein